MVPHLRPTIVAVRDVAGSWEWMVYSKSSSLCGSMIQTDLSFELRLISGIVLDNVNIFDG